MKTTITIKQKLIVTISRRFVATFLAGILLFTTRAASAVPVANLVFTDPNLAACVNNTAATWASRMRAVSRR